jgi:hypothetical protein
MILQEYLQTIFIAEESPAAGWPDSFAVISACDPFSKGERLHDDRSSSDLLEHLSTRGFNHQKIIGASRDLLHQELSFAVWGVTLEKALEIGRIFHQNAIFWVDHGQVDVVSCTERDRQHLGRWEVHFNQSPYQQSLSR